MIFGMTKNRLGFTLVEVLLGLTLFSFVALTLYSVFSSGIMLERRFGRENDARMQVHWALERMARDLENAVGYDLSASYPEEAAFAGLNNRVTFLIEKEYDLVVVEYYLKPMSESRILKTLIGQTTARNVAVTESTVESREAQMFCRRETPFLDFLNQDGGRSREEILSIDFIEDGLELSYGTWSPGDDQVVWMEEWKRNVFPAMIGVNVRYRIPGESEPGHLRKSILNPAGSVVTAS